MKEAEHIHEKMGNIKERVGSWRADIKFNQVTEEKFEKDHEIEVYRQVSFHLSPTRPGLLTRFLQFAN